jgi:hypothetical protein
MEFLAYFTGARARENLRSVARARLILEVLLFQIACAVVRPILMRARESNVSKHTG